MSRVICWFSCGVPSTVALILSRRLYGADLTVATYTEAGGEHPDNKRYLKDVERRLGLGVIRIKSTKYKGIDDVFVRERFLRGRTGARCTVEMKKEPRRKFQTDGDVHIFGYTNDKKDRKRAFRLQKQNPEIYCRFPLVEMGLKRKDCFRTVIKDYQLKPPITYEQGLPNANCLGCVKSESPTYWLRVKELFPSVFWRRANQERDLNFALCRVNKKPIFLDELTPDLSTGKMEPITCDFLCGALDE